jgi:NTE family protein
MKKRQEKPRIGLALGSGGARGLSHIAFLKVLDDLDLKPSIISGTSMGALIGAFYSAGMTGKEIEQLFDDMGVRKMGRMMDLSIFSNSGLLKGKKVKEFLDKNLPVKDFARLRIPLKIVATDFWRREEVVFDSGDLVTAIRASIAIPVVMEPIQVGGKVLTDGGTVNPLPYDLIRDDCNVLVAIDVSGERVPEDHDPVPSMLENIFTTFQTMQASVIRSMMKTSKPDILIQPHLKNIQMMDFYRKDEIFKGVQKEVEQFRETIAAMVEKDWKSNHG